MGDSCDCVSDGCDGASDDGVIDGCAGVSDDRVKDGRAGVRMVVRMVVIVRAMGVMIDRVWTMIGIWSNGCDCVVTV